MHEILKFDDERECMDVAAKFICKHAAVSCEQHGFFTLCLAGGNTPRPLYRLLARRPYNNDMPWERTHIFWGDERCLPLDHKDSNFRMAEEEMLSKVKIGDRQVHVVPVGEGTAEKVAARYERHMRDFFRSVYADDEERLMDPFPRFDLLLLGMGGDGHMASLFPDSPALKEDKRWVAPVKKPGAEPMVPRITITIPVINNASCVMFLVTGKEKHDLVSRIADGVEGKPPAAQVSPMGTLVWFISS